ncbi:MAG: FkbM family methyltransferase [Anaerolineaceae bacterium]|nr:FkbM family methyltransferase [Anaerolineaceae bacterium]
MKNVILSTAAFFAKIMPVPLRKLIYKIPFIARFVRGKLNQAAPEGLSKVEIAAGNLKGVKMYLNLHLEKDYWLGTYEADLQKILNHYVRPGMVAYDIGANIGYISLLFAQAVGETGKVFAFEALPANVERLRQNLFASGFQNRIIPTLAAVSNTNQPVEFLVHASTSMGKISGAAGRETEDYLEKIQVPGIRLDDFIFEQNHPKPDVIKLDIEGGEVLAIQAMRRVLKECHPIMLIELHGPDSAKAVGAALSEAGYQAFKMEHPHQPIDLLHPDHWKAYVIAR